MSKAKTLLIVGAKSDLALSCAHQYASNGFDLQLAGREILIFKDEVQQKLKKYNVKISFLEFDMLNYSCFTSFISNLRPLPDVVICLVGTLGSQNNHYNSIDETSLIIKTNYEGPSIFLGKIAESFEKRRSGSIIAISSVAGLRGRRSNYVYGSAKSGLATFLSGLRAKMYEANVSVMTVIPGYIDTKMIANIKTPKLLTSSPDNLAKKIFKNRGKDILYSSISWKIIMRFICIIPERIFKKLNL